MKTVMDSFFRERENALKDKMFREEILKILVLNIHSKVGNTNFCWILKIY